MSNSHLDTGSVAQNMAIAALIVNPPPYPIPTANVVDVFRSIGLTAKAARPIVALKARKKARKHR